MKSNGDTPLHLAARDGHGALAPAFSQAGANNNARNQGGLNLALDTLVKTNTAALGWLSLLTQVGRMSRGVPRS